MEFIVDYWIYFLLFVNRRFKLGLRANKRNETLTLKSTSRPNVSVLSVWTIPFEYSEWVLTFRTTGSHWNQIKNPIKFNHTFKITIQPTKKVQLGWSISESPFKTFNEIHVIDCKLAIILKNPYESLSNRRETHENHLTVSSGEREPQRILTNCYRTFLKKKKLQSFQRISKTIFQNKKILNETLQNLENPELNTWKLQTVTQKSQKILKGREGYSIFYLLLL